MDRHGTHSYYLDMFEMERSDVVLTDSGHAVGFG